MLLRAPYQLLSGGGAAPGLTYSLRLDRASQTSGEHAYITDANQTGLNFSPYGTLEAWVKFDQLPSEGDQYFVLTKYGYAISRQQYMMGFQVTSGVLKLHNYVSPGNASLRASKWADVTSVITSAGVWYHIANTIDLTQSSVADELTIYVNGNKQTNITVTNDNNPSSIPAGAEDFQVGAYHAQFVDAYFFDGLIADARVWSVARTEAQIQANMSSTVSPSSSGLEANWLFQQDLTDETSNGNDLSFSGTASYDEDAPY